MAKVYKIMPHGDDIWYTISEDMVKENLANYHSGGWSGAQTVLREGHTLATIHGMVKIVVTDDVHYLDWSDSAEEHLYICDGREITEASPDRKRTYEVNEVTCLECLESIIEVYGEELRKAQVTLDSHPKAIAQATTALLEQIRRGAGA